MPISLLLLKADKDYSVEVLGTFFQCIRLQRREYDRDHLVEGSVKLTSCPEESE